MSDCDACLYSDTDCSDGSIDYVSIVRLETNMRCCECRGLVLAGQPIEKAEWYVEDEDGEECERDAIFTCVVCAEIADAFYCEGRMYNCDLWEGMHEIMSLLNSSCFDRLTTPQAKAELQRRWMEWKGLA